MKNSKNYSIGIVFLIGAFLFFPSCDLVQNGDDFLNRNPKDTPAPDIFFVDESSAKAAVTAAYQPWSRSTRMYQRDLVIMFDGMSDDGHWRPSRGSSIQLSQWNITPEHDIIEDYWDHAYQSVNAANYAIESIPVLLDKGLTQEQLDPYIADAHFMRGFSYLFLVNFFGEVPLIDSPLSSIEEFEQPRASTAQIYDQIIADFSFAKDNLPAEWPSEFTGSATRATAAAYLAKAYLYTEDYPAAETAARDAIQIAEDTGYALVDDYMSIFDINNEANPELLFYIPYIEADDYGANYVLQRLVREAPPELSHIQGVAGWGYHLPQRDLYDAFEDGDPRRGYTIFAPGDEFGVYSGAAPFDYTHEFYNESGQEVTEDVTYAAGDVVAYDYRWSPSGMNVRKGIYNIGHLANARWGGLDVPVMRMADLYLILGEALAEQGDVEALDWVNAVRSRATVNMPDKTLADGDLVELVRHERRVELALEGQRLWDLVRWEEVKNVFGDGTQVKRHFYSDHLPADNSNRFDSPALDNYPDDQILFPIPQDELDQNSQINLQNPGY